MRNSTDIKSSEKMHSFFFFFLSEEKMTVFRRSSCLSANYSNGHLGFCLEERSNHSRDILLGEVNVV